MQTYTANEAKTHFGALLDAAQRGPVQVTRHKRVVGVMVGAQDYEDMRRYYHARFLETIKKTAAEAKQRGLTEEKLKALLEDED